MTILKSHFTQKIFMGVLVIYGSIWYLKLLKILNCEKKPINIKKTCFSKSYLIKLTCSFLWRLFCFFPLQPGTHWRKNCSSSTVGRHTQCQNLEILIRIAVHRQMWCFKWKSLIYSDFLKLKKLQNKAKFDKFMAKM